MSGLVLASTSSRRLALLAQIGVIPDRVLAPAIDETPRRAEAPRDYALRIAIAKAGTVDAPRILAADTVVALGRRILPKAEDETQARHCLALISGRRHRVYTAVVLAEAGRLRHRLVESTVTFARLGEVEIAELIAAGDWAGKAGGYAIQGQAARFIRFLSGSYSNVVGLPLYETAALLRS